MTIDHAYQNERNNTLTRICDDAKLPVHPPYALYAQRLDPRNELELVVLHQTRRDVLQGRDILASIGQSLATKIAAGDLPMSELRNYARYMQIRPALQHLEESMR
jgi:hypothetical protein